LPKLAIWVGICAINTDLIQIGKSVASIRSPFVLVFVT
jgi:hypothetical protein